MGCLGHLEESDSLLVRTSLTNKQDRCHPGFCLVCKCPRLAHRDVFLMPRSCENGQEFHNNVDTSLLLQFIAPDSLIE